MGSALQSPLRGGAGRDVIYQGSGLEDIPPRSAESSPEARPKRRKSSRVLRTRPDVRMQDFPAHPHTLNPK